MVQYIAQLLTEQDCVIIPEVGGLVGNYQPARVDMHSRQILPPVKQIAFNRSLIHNDGLLANRVSVAEGMMYGDALNKVREFARQCMTSLEQNGSCVLEGIGRLYFDAEKRIQFAPMLGQNYLADAYGLPALELKPVQRFREAAKVIAATAEPSTPVVLEPNVPVAPVKWLYTVLGSLAIIALVTSFALNLSQVEKGTDFSSIFPFPLTTSAPAPQNTPPPVITVQALPVIDIHDTTIPVVENDTSIHISEVGLTDTAQTWVTLTQNNNFRQNTLPAIPLPLMPLDTFNRGQYFTIVVGAFIKQKNATRFAGQLEREGYDVHVMPNGPFRRVGLMFDTAEYTLQTALDSVKKSVHDSAWVLE